MFSEDADARAGPLQAVMKGWAKSTTVDVSDV